MVAGPVYRRPTAPLMLRAVYRPWPSANCHRLNPAHHVASSVALSNAGNFTKGHTLYEITPPERQGARGKKTLQLVHARVNLYI